MLVLCRSGWHLGERNMWEKKGLDELDAHIPLVVRVPWLEGGSSGWKTSALAEAVDIMPTLIELANLPPCPERLGGSSLVPAIKAHPSTGTGAGLKLYAFSQFPRCNCTYQTDALDVRNGTCPQVYVNAYTAEHGATGACNHHVCLFTQSSEFDWMGYSVRSKCAPVNG